MRVSPRRLGLPAHEPSAGTPTLPNQLRRSHAYHLVVGVAVLVDVFILTRCIRVWCDIAVFKWFWWL